MDLPTKEELDDIYKYLERWTKHWHIGGQYPMYEYQKYDDKIWLPIAKVIKFAEYENTNLNSDNRDIILNYKYVGPIYRMMEYVGHDKGVVYPLNNYQSWTSNIKSLQYLSYKINNPVIIESFTFPWNYAIDVNNFLNSQDNSSIYQKECEITVPTVKDNIERIYTGEFINVDRDTKKLVEIKEIPKENWFRDNWHSESDV